MDGERIVVSTVEMQLSKGFVRLLSRFLFLFVLVFSPFSSVEDVLLLRRVKSLSLGGQDRCQSGFQTWLI